MEKYCIFQFLHMNIVYTMSQKQIKLGHKNVPCKTMQVSHFCITFVIIVKLSLR